jgi:hypothetical protein
MAALMGGEFDGCPESDGIGKSNKVRVMVRTEL